MKFSRILRLTFSLMFLLSVIFCGIFVYVLYSKIEVLRKESAEARQRFEHIQRLRTEYDQIQNRLTQKLITKSTFNQPDFITDFQNFSNHFQEWTLSFPGGHNFSASLFKVRAALNMLDATDDLTQYHEALNIIQTHMYKVAQCLMVQLDYTLSNKGVWSKYTNYLLQTLLPYIVIYLVVMSAFLIIATLGNHATLNRQLQKLSEGTRSLSRGDLGFRFPIHVMDEELDYVMFHFNQMAQKLEHQNQMIMNKHAQLEALAESLVESNQHKDRFLANMSHELRTPLNAIIGFSELLHARAETNSIERNRTYAKQILDAAEHLLLLISDLLDLARMDAGIKEPSFTRFDLVSCVDSAATMIKPAIYKKHLSLTWTPPENTENERYIIDSDRRFICQILINFLNNACKFTKEGGITVSLDLQDEHFRIAVTDTGIGIKEDDIPLVFKDFHRLDPALSGNHEGLGLGMTLSRRLANLLGGDIELESCVDQGSTFTLILPRERHH